MHVIGLKLWSVVFRMSVVWMSRGASMWLMLQEFDIDLEGAQTVRFLCYRMNGDVGSLISTCALEVRTSLCVCFSCRANLCVLFLIGAQDPGQSDELMMWVAGLVIMLFFSRLDCSKTTECQKLKLGAVQYDNDACCKHVNYGSLSWFYCPLVKIGKSRALFLLLSSVCVSVSLHKLLIRNWYNLVEWWLDFGEVWLWLALGRQLPTIWKLLVGFWCILCGGIPYLVL